MDNKKENPKGSRKRFIYLSLALFIVIGLAMYLVVNHFVQVYQHQRKMLVSNQRRIVYSIAPDIYMNAANEMWANINLYRQDAKWHNVPVGDKSKPDPTDPNMPILVRQLLPNSIFIETDSIRFEFGGGSHHWGIDVFKNSRGDGLRELAYGVWYYSEDNQLP